MGERVKLQAIRGPALAMAAYGLYSLGDASIRGLGTRLPPFETAFIGGLVSLALAPLVLGRSANVLSLVRPKQWLPWIVRGGCAVGGTVSAIYALGRLPLAEAATILFLGPLLTALLVPLLVREVIGAATWVSIIGGFAGVLIVLRPGLRELTLADFAALICALCGAGAGLILRATQDKESAASMYGASVLPVVVVSGIALVHGFVVPAGETLGFLLLYTVCGALANLLLMFAWRIGPALAVAPTQYSQILWSLLLGLVLFSQIPDLPTALGAAIIVVAGLSPRIFERAVH